MTRHPPSRRAERAARSTRRALLGGIAALAAFAPVRPAAARTGGEARTFIETLGRKVEAVLKDRQLARDAKLGRLVALLDEATDMPLVARLVMGKYWREASEAQRKSYVELFQALVIKTMADRLNNYGGETFEVTGSRSAGDLDTVVSTRILRPGGQPPIAVDWRVREAGKGHAIIDIVAEGVSMVVTQRSELTEIVSQQGIDGLLAEMRRRLDRPAT